MLEKLEIESYLLISRLFSSDQVGAFFARHVNSAINDELNGSMSEFRSMPITLSYQRKIAATYD